MLYSSLQKYLFFLILVISACQRSATISRPNISNIEVQVEIERFDQELATLQAQDILEKNRIWQQQYGYFYSDYMIKILEIGSPKDSLYVQHVLSQVLQKKDFKDLSAAVEKVYPNMDKYEAALEQAMKYVKYYFPAYPIPRFIAFVGGFAVQTPVGNDYVGIGLDMFLGADSEFYPALTKSIPRYISRRFTPENIVPRVVEAILREDIYPQRHGDVNTLAHMIYNGKILYALDCLLDVPDVYKIGYTEQQLKWAKQHQADVWAWFIQENLLYNTDYLRIQKYFTEAPFTPELGENNESAPKLGSYIGWMIVRRYMEKHPEMNLKELFMHEDAQEILEGSKFKGK